MGYSLYPIYARRVEQTAGGRWIEAAPGVYRYVRRDERGRFLPGQVVAKDPAAGYRPPRLKSARRGGRGRGRLAYRAGAKSSVWTPYDSWLARS